MYIYIYICVYNDTYNHIYIYIYIYLCIYTYTVGGKYYAYNVTHASMYVYGVVARSDHYSKEMHNKL